MFLGIEIGGTKLQLGVGRGDGTPLEAWNAWTSTAGAARAFAGRSPRPAGG